ncbi:aldose 1-epimerase [Mariniphaga anaerophila]|uniref:Aldose 1-epimerase n=1 Tax=Mariniphaga anaerophila TaxID=1484053 RepID=A0A1M4YRI1_9BACT|nr:aldose epimerase family protein [Mariniphaga anaerophila]SHF08112.1 aldose 1-epimerase [Mariniphaga anaerophila]
MMKNLILLLTIIAVAACTPQPKQPELIDEETFAGTLDGKEVELFALKNVNGLVAQITNFGGRVVSLWLPDANGAFEDVVTGYETLEGYLKSNEVYYGALIGRYGNRIAKGKFALNDTVYTLAQNNGENHLHGGVKGFNNVVWDAACPDGQTLVLTYTSPDMEEGYPGTLKVKVQYTLTDSNELKIEYWATTDRPTPVNLTHHSFFNLKGAGNGTINDHLLQINADYYTPVDEGLIPSGEIAPVDNTPMDFRKPTAIGKRVDADFDQLKYGRGYDHNWVLVPAESGLNFAARVEEPVSGRTLEVYTNEPGVQFYGGNFLDGSDTGKKGKVYSHRSTFCLETQHFPDSPNQPDFPSTILNPGEEYYSVCVYRFGVKE